MADAAFARAREVGTGQLGRVRVGFSPAIGPLDRDDVVRALRPPGSDVSVALHEVRPGELRPLLRSHELDVALTRASGARDDTLHSAQLRPTPIGPLRPGRPSPGGARGGHARRPRRRAAARGQRARQRLHGPAGRRGRGAGATVTLVEARVTGGAALLTELAEERRGGADAGRHAGA